MGSSFMPSCVSKPWKVKFYASFETLDLAREFEPTAHSIYKWSAQAEWDT